MPPETASAGYASHRRYVPLFHFTAIPILVINLIVRIVVAVRHPEVKLFWWEIVVAAGLVCLAFAARLMALAVQDRLIRLEETLRMERLLPADLRGRVGELSTGQLIALRFCHDDELPELTRAVLTEPIHKREAIKKRIRSWRPDLRPRA
jgi:hypothetical protein